MGLAPSVLRGMNTRSHLGNPLAAPCSAQAIARRCRHHGPSRTVTLEHFPTEVARVVGALSALRWINLDHEHICLEDREDLSHLLLRRARSYAAAFDKQDEWFKHRHLELAVTVENLKMMIALVE